MTSVPYGVVEMPCRLPRHPERSVLLRPPKTNNAPALFGPRSFSKAFFVLIGANRILWNSFMRTIEPSGTRRILIWGVPQPLKIGVLLWRLNFMNIALGGWSNAKRELLSK